jgi:hypothetical protein
MTDPEPTLEYALDCAWQDRLRGLGFTPDAELNEDVLHYCWKGYRVVAQWHFGLTNPLTAQWSDGVSFFVGNDRAHIQTVCTPQNAYYYAVLLIEFLHQHPSEHASPRLFSLAHQTFMAKLTRPVTGVGTPVQSRSPRI